MALRRAVASCFQSEASKFVDGVRRVLAGKVAHLDNGGRPTAGIAADAGSEAAFVGPSR
jgi:hypothetical protein